jgi:hypothetical protein
MSVVDSSAWLEYFSGGPNARFFDTPIKNLAELVVPTIIVYEVFKRVLATGGETDALSKVAYLL